MRAGRLDAGRAGEADVVLAGEHAAVQPHLCPDDLKHWVGLSQRMRGNFFNCQLGGAPLRAGGKRVLEPQPDTERMGVPKF